MTNRPKALIFKNIAILCQVVYAITAKKAMEGENGVTEFDLMFVRSAVSLFHALIVVKCVGVPIYGPELSENPHTRKMLLLRSCVGVIGFGSFVFAIARLPIGVINIIGSTKPFWSSILAYFVLGEAVYGLEIVFMVCSFGGILLIAIASLQNED